MPNADIYEFNVDTVYNGQQQTNVFHVKQVGPDGSGDPRTSVSLMWQNVFETNFLAFMCDKLDLVQYRTRKIQVGQTQSLIEVATGTGAVVSAGMPTNCCAILRLYGARTLGRGIGNKKFSGMSQGGVEDGRINSALAVLLMAFGNPMELDQLEASQAFTWRMCVYSLVDNLGREVVKVEALPRTKTIHSRTIGVGQ